MKERLRRLVCAALAALLLIAAPACLRDRRQREQTPLARCLQSLNKIPMLTGVLRSRGVEGESTAEEKPFAGLQIALTINGMVRGAGEPQGGIDSWCEHENSRDNFDKLVAALRQNQMPPTVAFLDGQSMDGAILKSG